MNYEKQLIEAIKEAKTNEELQEVINSIPKQSNGFTTQLFRVLDDAFWYTNLTTLESKQEFMISRVPVYINTVFI